uniref:Uncharacterized protein n=1 Tax=Meloidogyne javanica TaxID=6303 RepID=A0A915MC89_MELJA
MLANTPSKAVSPRARETQQTMSSIEEYIKSKEIPVLDVCIEKRIKCYHCEGDKYFNEMYKILKSGSIICSKCLNSMQGENKYKIEKEKINLPRCCRNIASPILQNGTKQEFTYNFDFNMVQDENTNINFVQLKDISSGHQEEGFQTPLNLPFNFAHLNMEEAESSKTGGSKARKSFAGFEGLKLNFEDIDDTPEGSAPSNIPRPRKSNAHRRIPPRASVDLPSSSHHVRDSGNEGIQEGNNSARSRKDLRRSATMQVNRRNRNDMSNRRSDVEGCDNNQANTRSLYGVGSHSFDGIQGQASSFDTGNWSGSHDQTSGFGTANWTGNQDSSNFPPLFPQQLMHGSIPHQFQPGSFPHQPQPGSLPQQWDPSQSFPQPFQPGVEGNLPVFNHPLPGQEQQLYGQGYQYPPNYYQYPPQHEALNTQHGHMHYVPQASNNAAGSENTGTSNIV